jgi:small subunit ribosomal protein S14
MARKSMMEKLRKPVKFVTRARKRCVICGRPRGFIGKFEMCRICFRNLALKGELPGVIKSSW